MKIKIYAPIEPFGKQRTSTTIEDSRVKHYTPGKTRKFEKDLGLFANQSMEGKEPLKGPLKVIITFKMPIPKSWPKWKQSGAREGSIVPTAKPDIDNLLKSALDACNAIVWEDDNQIVDLYTRMRFADTPSVNMIVEQMLNWGAQLIRKPKGMFIP